MAQSSNPALPIIQEPPPVESHYRSVKQKEAEILRAIQALSLDDLRVAVQKSGLLSQNGKTSVSLDFPIGQTCTPTRICSSVCYALVPGATLRWSHCLTKRLRNWRYVREAPALEVARQLARDFGKRRRDWARDGVRLDFLRINGEGDLFPEIVPVINYFAALNQDVRVWVVTRRFAFAESIAPLSNIYLQLSLDSSTQPKLLERAEEIVKTHPRAYLSFLRTQPEDDTQGAAIVFDEKRTVGLPFDEATGCPVDAGLLPLENNRNKGGTACSKCRKCFTDTVFQTQAELRPDLRPKRSKLSLVSRVPEDTRPSDLRSGQKLADIAKKRIEASQHHATEDTKAS